MGWAQHYNQVRGMMKKELKFDGTDEARQVYEALHKALRFGRNHIQKVPGKDVLRRERTVRKLLEAAGVPAPTERDDMAFTIAGPATIVVDQSDIELMMERIDGGMWAGDMSVCMADAYDFVSGAPEFKG